MSAEQRGPGDPGLQAERTALAWQRTGVSGSLVGGLALLTAAHNGRGGVLAVTAALAAAAAGAAWYAAAHHQRSVGQPGSTPWPRLVATAAIPVLLAVSGLLIVAF